MCPTVQLLFDALISIQVRYHYGREGRRVDMSPYSCVALISGPGPAAGETHGCPYRNLEPNLLSQKLNSIPGLESPTVREPILAQVRAGHYQLACREVFRLSHGLDSQYDVAINHPNQYWAEGVKLTKAGSAVQKEVKEVRRVSVPAAASCGQQSQQSDNDDTWDDSAAMDLELSRAVSEY